MATIQEAEAARRANEELFEWMGAHAIEIAGSGSEHELIVHSPVSRYHDCPRR